MRRRAAERTVSVLAAAFLVAFFVQAAVRSAGAVADGGANEESGLFAEAQCDRVSGPGKVHCSVLERPIMGKLSWGDVIVLSAPPFAPPLRTRIAAGDATRRDESGAEFALALAATGDGSGELRVLARAVVCSERGCRPVRAEAKARVVVGTETP